MPLKVKQATSDVDNIRDQADDLIALAESVIRNVPRAMAEFEKGLEEETDGGLTPETCAAGLNKFSHLHKKTRLLDIRAWILHNRIEDHIPEGMNEGNKCP